MKTHLFFGLLTVVLLVIVIGSRRQEAFVFEDVIDMAQAIAPGIDFANRFHIWMGVMAYLGSPIWLLFLMAGAVDLAFKYRFSLLSALPGSDISHSGGAVQVLLLATLALLFLPKILAMFLAIPKAGQFGGAVRLVASTLIETAIWTLLAPAIMLYYTQFVVMNLAGLHVRWTAQNRSNTGLGFLESFHIFWMPPVIGVIATTVLAIWARDELWLLSPILVGCLIAPVLAWMTSQPKLGEWARRHRLFLTPEENPELCPAELRFVDQAAAVSTNSLSLPFGGIARAVIDPLTHSVHVVLLRQRKAGGLQTEGYLVGLRQKLIEEGPAALEPSQLYALLWDADSMRWLHREFWSRPAVRLHPWWRERLDDVIEKIGLTS